MGILGARMWALFLKLLKIVDSLILPYFGVV